MKNRGKEESLDRHPEIEKIKRKFRIAAGFTLLVLAVPAFILPFPATTPLIVLGLLLLSVQYLWARRLIKKMKKIIKLEKKLINNLDDVS